MIGILRNATTWALILFALLPVCSLATEAYRVLPMDFNAVPEQQMMRAYLRKQVHAALDRRQEELNLALRSAAGVAAFQQRRRDFLDWTLGEMPARTPLNSTVTGTVVEDDFTIECVMFASQPGFHVVANLYRPLGNGPYPAILHACGHTEDGKAAEVYQRVNRLLARNGFIVLCYDPIGQGERKQLLDAAGDPSHQASREHQELGVPAILLGRGLASYMVWDGVRAIDYLLSRSDVDSARIGCTGNSGGGNMTSYLMAFDERILAAAPGCFLTTHRQKNESPGPGDAEQNLFAQIREGFDHADFILARAPKPTLLLSATDDFVPIAGTWEAFREAKRLYTRLGFPERVDLVEANAEHGYSRRLREGAVRFFAQSLQGRTIEVFEGDDLSVRSAADLQVTPQGQVRKLQAEKSIFDLFAERERHLASRRPTLTPQIVRKVTEIRPLDQIPQPQVEQLDSEGAPTKVILRPEPGIVLPALWWAAGAAQPILMAHDQGMNAVAEAAAKLNAEGHPVLVVEVRDTGETKTKNWRFPGADDFVAYMLGRSWLAMRAEDLLVSARWLSEHTDRKPVRLVAHGQVGPAALHAAFLEPAWIGSTHVIDSLTSWQQLMSATDASAQVHNMLHGALRFYDIPHLLEMLQQ